MNRKVFYDKVRRPIFRGRIPQSAVATIDAIFDEWEKRKLKDLRWLADMLSTVRGENGTSFKCLREIGRGKGKKYGRPDPKTGHVYYGRCLVQLTWADNYKKMGKLLNLPLYENPDLALQLPVAVQIMFEGMIRGTFTGKKLSDYFNASKTDWYNARRIINGTDKAADFANWSKIFYEALLEADRAAPEPVAVTKPKPQPQPPVADVKAPEAVGAASAAGGAAVAAAKSGFDWWLVALIAVSAGLAALIVIKAVRK